MTVLAVHPKSKKAKDKPAPWLEDGKVSAYRAPAWTSYDLKLIEDAARLHAKANVTDPFAYDRVKMHMIRGYDLYSDISTKAKAVLASRGGYREE